MINIFFMCLGVLSIVQIYLKVKRKLFSEKESILWMFAGIIILVLSVFPKIIDKLSNFLGISYPPSLLFLLCILYLFYMNLRSSQQLSLLNEKTKELAQKNSLLEEEIREIKKTR